MFCRNTLRGMRVSLGRVLTWAVDCGWLPKNPCAGVKLPLAGKKVVRTILKPEQTRALVAKLEEPYATLVLFVAVTGLRISEAIGIKWTSCESVAGFISASQARRRLQHRHAACRYRKHFLHACRDSEPVHGYSGLVSEKPSIPATRSSGTFILHRLSSASAWADGTTSVIRWPRSR